MPVSFTLRPFSGNPHFKYAEPLTSADGRPGAGSFGGIDQPGRVHLVSTASLSAENTAVYAPMALAEGETVKLDVDFSPGDLRLYILDTKGALVAENNDSGAIDLGSPGLLDPALNFLPSSSGVYYFVVTGADNEYEGDYMFGTSSAVTGSFQLDISADRLPKRIVLGDTSDDFFASEDTAHRILGRGGSDRFFLFGINNDKISGGRDDDTINADAGHDVLIGGGGSDIIECGIGNDLAFGGPGNDFLTCGDGDDEAHGGTGSDFVYGGKGNDRIYCSEESFSRGGDGDDFMVGGDQNGEAGNDTMIGDGGSNQLDGGEGNNTILGLKGNDSITVGDGDDAIDGGSGTDTVIADPNGQAVTVHLAAGTMTGQGADTLAGIEVVYLTILKDNAGGDGRANTIYGLGGGDVIDGLGGDDRLFGDDGNDILSGGFGDNSLFGNGGNDMLIGGGDNDQLEGAAGKDVLTGWLGSDTLTGGLNADRFRFISIGDSVLGASDVITDFKEITGDYVDLSDIDAVTASDEDDSFTPIWDLPFSFTPGELRISIEFGDTYLGGDVDGDGLADFEIIVQGIVEFGPGSLIL